MGWGDTPYVPRNSVNHRCGHGDNFVFSTGSHPYFCDVSLPSGTRPSASILEDTVPYEAKINQAFWRGSVWPSRRCGPWKESPRVLMVKASALGSTAINASFCARDCKEPKEPEDLCRWVRQQKPGCVPFEEQLKYRFLPTSAPSCAYTGRLQVFIQTNSIVSKFTKPAELDSQPMYGGLQDNVHLVLLKPKTWEGQLKQLQKSPESLAQIPRNAKAYSRWALSQDVRDCYFLKLLSGYLEKLAYSPARDGTLGQLLQQRRSRKSQRQVHSDILNRDITVEIVHFNGEEFQLYSLAATSTGGASRLETAVQRQCARAMAAKPVDMVYHVDQGKWGRRS